MATKIQIRRDTAANWSSANTVLSQGEIGYDLTNGRFKIGNGSTAWNDLSYSVEALGHNHDSRYYTEVEVDGLINDVNGDISANTTDIASNTNNISSNTSNIATNTASIATNASGIATNASGIAANATSIGVNAADIAAAETDIAGNTSLIQGHIADTDNPHTVTKTQVGLGDVENYGIANQTEAEEGTATNKYMTPQRTKEAILELSPPTDLTAVQSHIDDSTIHFTQAQISITESQISDLGTYEPAFVKNTAFNKNFGTSAGTVSEGDHGHSIAQITGLQTALDGKTTESYVNTAIDNLVNGASASFDTLKEIQDAMATDAELSAAIGALTIGNGTQTVSVGPGLTGGGVFSANQTSNSSVVIEHDDTSTQASVDNSGATVIQDVTLDGFGHTTGLGSVTITPALIGAQPAGSYLGSGSTAVNSDKVDGYHIVVGSTGSDPNTLYFVT